MTDAPADKVTLNSPSQMSAALETLAIPLEAALQQAEQAQEPELKTMLENAEGQRVLLDHIAEGIDAIDAEALTAVDRAELEFARQRYRRATLVMKNTLRVIRRRLGIPDAEMQRDTMELQLSTMHLDDELFR